MISLGSSSFADSYRRWFHLNPGVDLPHMLNRAKEMQSRYLTY